MLYTALKGTKDKPRQYIRCFGEYDRFRADVLNAKIYKVLSHLYVFDDWSVWTDANIYLKVEPKVLLEMLGDKEIGVFPNPYHTCLYQEAKYCIEHGLDDPKVILEQIKRYQEEGFPTEQGLGGCGVLVRRHTEKIKRLNEQWWAEICKGSVRDQISFPYVFRDEIKYFEKVDFWDNKYWKRIPHGV
jgi:hypothetical protein